jgi:hypothetical protein
MLAMQPIDSRPRKDLMIALWVIAVRNNSSIMALLGPPKRANQFKGRNMASRDPSSPADRRKNPARKKTDRRKSNGPPPEAKSKDDARQMAPERSDDEPER